jgi:hypothetical protein
LGTQDQIAFDKVKRFVLVWATLGTA